MSESLSILHLLDTEGVGGRESVVEMLARAQMDAGHSVRVTAVVERRSGQDRPDPPFLRMAAESGIPLTVMRLPPRSYLEERRRLRTICASEGPDVLHTHGYRPDVVAASLPVGDHPALVSTVHGFTRGDWKNRLYELLQRLAYRRFDAVVAVSRSVARFLADRGVTRERLHVVPNGWRQGEKPLSRAEARARLGVGDEEFLVGWVGRLSREKGPDVLIDALCVPGLKALSVSMIGGGGERRRLEARAEAVPARHTVRWHGRIPKASRLYPAFDVFVLSSRSEGTPIVAFEAMAAGVPVVATRVGGVGDILSSREAWLVPPESPDSLARAIRRVREQPQLARERAAAAREVLNEEFGVKAWVSRYDRVYRQAMQR